MPISKLLVANRAEIAVRVIESAAAMGVRTVAVHPADDAACAHVARADEAVQLDGEGPAAYLDAAALVRAAGESGCDAVHPGYGFLSESAGFAARCADAGLVFVGPAPDVLELLGDKSRARDLATSLDIPVPPGTTGPTDLDTARAFLEGLGAGAAIMIKALAGGGGRGMRPVRTPAELDDAWARARSEAEQAFGDGSLYVEQNVTHARHIEVQLVGDGTGAVLALGDRDCSLQRRRQKLVEIAPAPNLPDAVRERLAAAAVSLGAGLAYRGLATVEFLVSGEQIAFLEVNPRIQVEHTVTEEVTGVDLVETAMRIAGGATLADLGLTTAPPTRGAAVQLRVNTERALPDGSVAPSAGVLTCFQPPTGRGVRVDTHGYPDYPVSPRYDSLLAKLVVSDPRAGLAGVVTRARRALDEFRIDGVDDQHRAAARVAGPPGGGGRADLDRLRRGARGRPPERRAARPRAGRRPGGHRDGAQPDAGRRRRGRGRAGRRGRGRRRPARRRGHEDGTRDHRAGSGRRPRGTRPAG